MKVFAFYSKALVVFNESSSESSIVRDEMDALTPLPRYFYKHVMKLILFGLLMHNFKFTFNHIEVVTNESFIDFLHTTRVHKFVISVELVCVKNFNLNLKII